MRYAISVSEFAAACAEGGQCSETSRAVMRSFTITRKPVNLPARLKRMRTSEEVAKARADLRETHRYSTAEEVRKAIDGYMRDSDERRVLDELLQEKLRGEPEQRRFDQTERHHKDRQRLTRNAAIISLIGAAASWAGVLFNFAWHRSPSPPTPTPPAVASPSPAQDQLLPWWFDWIEPP
jgi:hypothetical protein